MLSVCVAKEFISILWKTFSRTCKLSNDIYTYFFISNQCQASALKVAYIFKAFTAQSSLMAAQQFDQVTLFCEGYTSSQDSEQIFMIIAFKVFPIRLLRQLNFGVVLVSKLFYVYYKRITPLFFNQQFLLLLSERGSSSESCLTICHPRASCL